MRFYYRTIKIPRISRTNSYINFLSRANNVFPHLLNDTSEISTSSPKTWEDLNMLRVPRHAPRSLPVVFTMMLILFSENVAALVQDITVVMSGQISGNSAFIFSELDIHTQRVFIFLFCFALIRLKYVRQMCLLSMNKSRNTTH